MDLLFFSAAAAWRAWLERNHSSRKEQLVGFYKVGSGKPSMTWGQSVDEALCFGWIDGVRRRIDDVSYSIRFTPRKRVSIWSTVNVNRVAELTAQGRMQPPGMEAFAARKPERSGIYAFEQAEIRFEPAAESLLRANSAAWEFFQTQPAWYRRVATWRIVSAKRAETREKRLQALIDNCADGRIPPELRRKQSR